MSPDETPTPRYVTHEHCETTHGASKAMQKLMVGLLGVVVALMSIFIIMVYHAASKADAAQEQGLRNEQLLGADVKATAIWRTNADAKFARIENKLDSIETHLRDGKRSPP